MPPGRFWQWVEWEKWKAEEEKKAYEKAKKPAARRR